jgi:hypothetical protein
MRTRPSLRVGLALTLVPTLAIDVAIAACGGDAPSDAPSPPSPNTATAGDAVAPDVQADAQAPSSTTDTDGATGKDSSDGRAPGDCTGSPICDDFESNVLGTAPTGWSVVIDPADAGTVTVDSTRSFSGTKSVKFTFNPQNVGRYSQIRRSLSFLTTNAFFGRMRIWLEAVPSHDTRHWEFLEAWGHARGGTPTQLSQYALGVGSDSVDGKVTALTAYYLANNCDCFQESHTPVPKSRWACVEWQFDGVSDQMHIWLDGTSIPALTVVNPVIGGHWAAPQFEHLNLGWYGVPDAPVLMWIDDVAVDERRIGCGS